MADAAKWAKFIDADGDVLYLRPEEVVAVKRGQIGRPKVEKTATTEEKPAVPATSKMFAAGNWAIEVVGSVPDVLKVLNGEATDTYPPLVKGGAKTESKAPEKAVSL